MSIAAIALPTTTFGAEAKSTVGPFYGACIFSPSLSSPALVATFTPDLTNLSGTGVCNGNAGHPETITLSLFGGSGLTCVGGTETLSGSVTWSGIVPSSHPGLSATAVGEGTSLQLIFDDPAFTATGSFEWISLGCPGNISPTLTGTMSFASN